MSVPHVTSSCAYLMHNFTQRLQLLNRTCCAVFEEWFAKYTTCVPSTCIVRHIQQQCVCRVVHLITLAASEQLSRYVDFINALSNFSECSQRNSERNYHVCRAIDCPCCLD